jgi:hypothetical protein
LIGSFGLALVTAGVLMLTGTTSSEQSVAWGVHPAGDSYFPLAQGNQWVFASYSDGQETSRDTIVIDRISYINGWRYYHLCVGWPGCRDGLWVRRDKLGNLIWAKEPGSEGQPFLRFDSKDGDRWQIDPGLRADIDSLTMYDSYAAVRTPYGLFDGVRSFGCLPSCGDSGWGVSTARGIGPVIWTEPAMAGGHERLLISASVGDDYQSEGVLTGNLDDLQLGKGVRQEEVVKQ